MALRGAQTAPPCDRPVAIGQRHPVDCNERGSRPNPKDPGARCVPTILPGFTDSRTWRATFPDCVAYGFFPQRHMSLYESAPLVHGADERIDVRDLELAAEFFEHAAREICG